MNLLNHLILADVLYSIVQGMLMHLSILRIDEGKVIKGMNLHPQYIDSTGGFCCPLYYLQCTCMLTNHSQPHKNITVYLCE